MKKAPDAFRTISEVADWLDVQAHVLRFWESKFAQVKPVKRAGGRRYYRPADMRLIGGIKTLLHDEGMTIKGVQKVLRERGADYVASLSQMMDEADMTDAAPAATEEAGAAPPAIEDVTLEVVAGEVSSEEVVAESAPEAPAAEPETPEPEVSAAEETPEAETSEPDPAEPPAPQADAPSETGTETTAEPEAEPEPLAAEAEPDNSEPEDNTLDDLPEMPTVVSFQSRKARPAPEASAPQQPEAAQSEPAQSEPEDETEAAPQKRTRRPQAERDLFEDLPDQPNLPAFLNRPALSEPEPEDEPAPAEDPTPAPLRAREVDAPDPAPDDEIAAAPGPLSRLAAMDRIPAGSVDALRALAQELRAAAPAPAPPSDTPAP